MRTILYRHYDADGILLYVGITQWFDRRMEQHRDTSEWYGEISKTVLEYYEERGLAEKQEGAAIKTENPRHNKRVPLGMDVPKNATVAENLRIRIRTDDAMAALRLKNRNELCKWFGMKNRQAVYQWGEYLPIHRAYELVDKRPELRRLVQDDAA